MKLFTVIKNIWSIKELRQRILFTLALLLVYRVGTFVVLPGIVPKNLKNYGGQNTTGDLFGLINTFTGGAFDNFSIFALGVMPYITASIIIQLLGFAVPYFQRLQTKEGESGRKRLNQITRLLTVAITLVQGGGYLQLALSTDRAVVPDELLSRTMFWFTNIIILTAGTVFCMWLGERITDKGIGNGTSLIIQAGIIARLPQAFGFEFQGLLQQNRILLFIVELALFFVIVMATVLVIQGVRRIPIQFAKRMVGRAGSLPTAGARDYLPLKVNSAGVMPIIFAQALMFLPATAIQYMSGSEVNTGRIHAFNDIWSFGYNALFFTLIVVFTYVYTALMINPQNYAEYLKRSNAFIPGVKPGEATSEYIDNIMTRITLPGAIFLGFIGILPSIAASLGVNQQFALFFGGTTLLIMVGVALDTLQVIESYLLTQKYDGLIKSGRIQGRSTTGVQVGQPQ